MAHGIIEEKRADGFVSRYYSAGAHGTHTVRIHNIRGRPGWYLTVRKNGKIIVQNRRAKIGNTPIASESAAIALADKMAADMHRDTTQQLLDRLKGPTPRTMDQLLGKYRESAGIIKPKRSDEAKATVVRRAEKLTEAFGPKELITGLETRLKTATFLDECRESFGWAPSTHRKYAYVLREMLRFALEELHWVPENSQGHLLPIPCLKDSDKRKDDDAYIYTDEELDALLQAVATDPRLDLILRIALDTGRRVGAIRRLRLKDFDRNSEGHAFVTWLAKYDKAGKRGLAVVGPKTLAALDRWLKVRPMVRGDWVFADIKSIDGCVTEDAALWALEQAEIRAGVEHISHRAFHALKRIAISRMMSKERLYFASRQSGTDIATLEKHYAKPNLDLQAAAFREVFG